MRSNGFSLIELVMVIVIVAILAAVVVPRLTDTGTYSDLGFYNDTKSILNYAQKSAVAQRRPVCVGFAVTQVTLTYDPAFGNVAPACTNNLTGPDGTAPYAVTAASPASGFAALPTDFYFNPQGQPSIAQTITFASGARNVTIATDTGYVQ